MSSDNLRKQMNKDFTVFPKPVAYTVKTIPQSQASFNSVGEAD